MDNKSRRSSANKQIKRNTERAKQTAEQKKQEKRDVAYEKKKESMLRSYKNFVDNQLKDTKRQAAVKREDLYKMAVALEKKTSK
tara:strand:- start:50 stop:301 length:252 start_codon:yes stop_codon:yes gene_type:complete